MLFLLGILVINTGFYLIVDKLLYKPYSLDLNQAAAYHSFLFADSHGKAIAQKDLDALSICNMSFNSDSYVDMYIKLNYLISNGIAIKKIYLTADEHTLSPYRETGNNNSRSVFLTDFTTYKEIYGKSFFDYLDETVFLKYFTICNTSKSKLIKEYIFTNKISEEVKDDNFKRFSDQERKEKAVKRIKSQFVKGKPSENLKLYLNKIIALCKKNNIKVLGIKLPLSKNYLEELKGKSYHAENEFLKSNIQVLDFKDVFIDNDAYFRDQDHLNVSGSKQFTAVFKKIKEN